MSSGATRFAVVLGAPVGHSLSPAMFTAAFAKARIDALYLAWHTEPDAFKNVVQTLANVNAIGASVTAPHKRAAFAIAQNRGDEAQRTGGVNCLSFDKGQIHGDNTDVYGFLYTLKRAKLTRGPVVVVGAGGAARAVVYALKAEGIEDIAICARRLVAAKEISKMLGGTAHAFTQRNALFKNAKAIVHATSASLNGDDSPIDTRHIDKHATVIDLSYGETPLVRAAKARQLKVFDGSTMLLYQAARAFELWTHKKAPLAAMAAALSPANFQTTM
jgi:shikimate dehydrogenase